MKIIFKKICIFVGLDTGLKFGKKRQTSNFLFKYGFFSLSFAVYLVFYFLSSIFKFSFKIILLYFPFFVSCLNIFILYVNG
jgi:hypothetical protein